jgi:hypothetical protein
VHRTDRGSSTSLLLLSSYKSSCDRIRVGLLQIFLRCIRCIITCTLPSPHLASPHLFPIRAWSLELSLQPCRSLDTLTTHQHRFLYSTTSHFLLQCIWAIDHFIKSQHHFEVWLQSTQGTPSQSLSLEATLSLATSQMSTQSSPHFR